MSLCPPSAPYQEGILRAITWHPDWLPNRKYTQGSQCANDAQQQIFLRSSSSPSRSPPFSLSLYLGLSLFSFCVHVDGAWSALEARERKKRAEM